MISSAIKVAIILSSFMIFGHCLSAITQTPECAPKTLVRKVVVQFLNGDYEGLYDLVEADCGLDKDTFVRALCYADAWEGWRELSEEPPYCGPLLDHVQEALGEECHNLEVRALEERIEGATRHSEWQVVSQAISPPDPDDSLAVALHSRYVRRLKETTAEFVTISEQGGRFSVTWAVPCERAMRFVPKMLSHEIDANLEIESHCDISQGEQQPTPQVHATIWNPSEQTVPELYYWVVLFAEDGSKRGQLIGQVTGVDGQELVPGERRELELNLQTVSPNIVRCTSQFYGYASGGLRPPCVQAPELDDSETSEPVAD